MVGGSYARALIEFYVWSVYPYHIRKPLTLYIRKS